MRSRERCLCGDDCYIDEAQWRTVHMLRSGWNLTQRVSEASVIDIVGRAPEGNPDPVNTQTLARDTTIGRIEGAGGERGEDDAIAARLFEGV